MEQIIFIMWRESIEALLLISIIYAWIKRQPDAKNGIKYLWYGVVLGIIFSIILAMAIYGLFNFLDDTSQSIFMIIMEITACCLIVQMVYWMKKNGSSMKNNVETDLTEKSKDNSWFGISLIVAISITREGSELVVFLSSFIMSLNMTTIFDFISSLSLGILAAIITIYLFSRLNHYIPWKLFFNTTSVILLFIALSLLFKGIDGLANLLLEFDFNIPNELFYPIWNTSGFIDDSGIIGSLLSSFFAYRSQPIELNAITLIIYWTSIIHLFLLRKKL